MFCHIDTRGWFCRTNFPLLTYLLNNLLTQTLTCSLAHCTALWMAVLRGRAMKMNDICGWTSREWSYLQQNAVQLFVCWIRAESKPSERVVPVIAENRVHRLRSKPTFCCTVIVRHLYDVCPAVVVDDCLESLGKSEVWPGNAHHRVKSLRIVERCTTAPLREKRAVPEGHEIPGCFTHCTQQRIAFTFTFYIFLFMFVFCSRVLVESLSALFVLHAHFHVIIYSCLSCYCLSWWYDLNNTTTCSYTSIKKIAFNQSANQ